MIALPSCIDPEKELAVARQFVLYDPLAGTMIWKKSKHGVGAGSIIGRHKRNGYPVVTLSGRRYYCHRLAWLLVHGKWPDREIDHINHDKEDFRLENLRDVSRKQNAENMSLKITSKSGIKGVRLRKDGRWVARITSDGKTRLLGYFKTAEDAHKAYCLAAASVHTCNGYGVEK